MPEKARIWPALVLLVITVVTYVPAMQAGFIWDDDDYVTENATLRSVDGLLRIWLQPGAVPQYYPLVHTTYWIEYHLWGLWAPGYHVVNILLHALNAVLIWRLLRQLEFTWGWFVAAVFAVHPVHVESVAWITERKNTLSAALYLLALLAYLRYQPLMREPTEIPYDRRRRAWWLALLGYVGALFSKTVTCSLPAAILLLTWWKRGRIRWRDVQPLLPFFIVGVLLSLVTVRLEATRVGATGEEWDFTALDRILIAGRAVWFYAGKLVWPADLVFIYHRWQIDPGVWWQYLYPAGAVALLVVLWLQRRRWGRGPLVAALFFGGTLLPALGFVNVYPMRYAFVADHFQYLASLGVLTLLVGFAGHALRGLGEVRRRVGPVLGSAVLVVLGVLAFRQTFIYQDLESLWRDTMERSPTAAIAWQNYGMLLLQQDRPAEAVPYFAKAVELRPRDLKYRNNLATAHYRRGDFGAALRAFHGALQIDPDDITTHHNLGVFYVERQEYDEAIRHFARAVAGQAATDTIREREMQLVQQSAKALDKLLPIRVKELQSAGRTVALTDLLTAVVRARPDDFERRLLLANTLFERGRAAEALPHYQHCVELRPQSLTALTRLAWIRATHPVDALRDGAAAVDLASRAVDAARMPNTLDALAAAWAETGDFTQAVAVATEAQHLAEQYGNARLARQIARRVALYRAGQPYRLR